MLLYDESWKRPFVAPSRPWSEQDARLLGALESCAVYGSAPLRRSSRTGRRRRRSRFRKDRRRNRVAEWPVTDESADPRRWWKSTNGILIQEAPAPVARQLFSRSSASTRLRRTVLLHQDFRRSTKWGGRHERHRPSASNNRSLHSMHDRLGQLRTHSNPLHTPAEEGIAAICSRHFNLTVCAGQPRPSTKTYIRGRR